LFFIAFDQRIDPAAVLETIQVKAGSRSYRLNWRQRRKSRSISKLPATLKALPRDAGWLFAAELLPADTQITVSVGPNTPSAEGPLVTQQSQVYSFYTYAPLKVADHGCWWSDTCRPLTPFFIRFNNPIDPKFSMKIWLP
jgi:alpha-2-macroglobulin